VQAAQAIRGRLDATAQAAYANEQRDYMTTGGMVDMGKALDAAALMLRSDRAAVGAYVADWFALDLRAGLSGIAAPVLVLAPYFALDAGQAGITAPMKIEQYRRQMAGTPRLEVATIDDSRDFLMIDQPEAFAEAVRRFINRP
jgi:pimeloyl-ACP methyl ester carboxylesterase